MEPWVLAKPLLLTGRFNEKTEKENIEIFGFPIQEVHLYDNTYLDN